MSDRLFRELCKPETLRIGWHLAQRASRDDFVRDPIDHADFAADLDRRLQHLLNQVRGGRYRPRHLIEIDIPKTSLSVRPGNVLPIEESTLLHAIIYLLAPKLDGALSEHVHSYRLHPEWKKRVKKGRSLFHDTELALPFLKRQTIRALDPFEAWYEAWPEFVKAAAKAAKVEGYTHVTKTDISAYFENIDLSLLEAIMRNQLKQSEDRTIEILFRVLRAWCRTTTHGTPIGRGIPQGNDVSSFLANLYVVSVDQRLSAFAARKPAKWLRYADDFQVFTRNEQDAREALFVINDALRQLHLNLQPSKTKILAGADLDEELDDSDMTQMNRALESIQKLSAASPGTRVTEILGPLSPIRSRFTRGLPKAVSNLDQKQSRIFRRLLTLYGRCQRTHFIDASFAALESLPDLRVLDKTLRYLLHMPYDRHDSILERLLSMVENDVLPFPYQKGRVLNAARELHPSIWSGVVSRIRDIGFRAQKPWFVQMEAACAIATFPHQERHLDSLAARLLEHESTEVRRAGCILLTRGSVNTFREEIEILLGDPDPSLARLASLFWRMIFNKEFAAAELDRLRRGTWSDTVAIRNLPRIYALRCSPELETVRSLREFVATRPRTRSTKVRRHLEHLARSTTWAEPKIG